MKSPGKKMSSTRSRRPGALAVTTLLVLLIVPGVATWAADGPVLQQSALEQIAVLLAEKTSRTPTQKKIASSLLYAARRQRGDDAFFAALPDLRTAVDLDRDGRTLVDVRATVSENLLVLVEEFGGEVVNSVPRYDSIRAWLALDALEALASRDDVRFIRPAERYLLNKIDTSEGDVAHAADQARTLFSADGSGVQVGVLSDSVDELAALQASGDLPAAVTVLPGQSGVPGSSEGTAMLEIVFDLAPGADLLFATALPTPAQFATNITDLAAAGADIIVDDIFYFAETAFQDGIVAQAVDAYTAAGGLYFSAAGNSGNLNDGTSGTWEGDFSSATTIPPAFVGADVNDFGGDTALNVITVDSPSVFTLRWSDPFGGSGNDYDLFLSNAGGTGIFAFSTNVQDGDDDPFEAIDSMGFDDTGFTLAIVRKPGSAGRCLHLSANRGRFSLATAGQTTGHAAAADAFGVAAVDVADAGGGVFTGGPTNPVEPFSSDGPRRIVLDAAGGTITPGNFSCAGGVSRDQPIIAAADGVMTATGPAPGPFNPFFGTSAAAPHAAAIAALMKESADLSPAGTRDVFAATALDIEAAGLDRDSGFGVLDANKAVGAVSLAGSCACGGSPVCPASLTFAGKPNNPATPGTVNAQARACATLTVGSGDFSNFEAAAPQLIFTDGFESGDVSVWSNTVP